MATKDNTNQCESCAYLSTNYTGRPYCGVKGEELIKYHRRGICVWRTTKRELKSK